MLRTLSLMLVAFLLPLVASATPLQDCAPQLPFGAPQIAGQPVPHHDLCRKAYVVEHNDATLEPAWVAYTLNSEHANGCLPRTDAFAPDPDLPRGRRAELADYLHAGYDRGHMAPDADFKWDATTETQSFYLSNMVPQLHALNAGIWFELEENVRAWATARGAVWVIDGPVFDAAPTTIGPDKLPVPARFYKVVVDLHTSEAVAFIIPHEPLGPTTPLAPYQVAVSVVEKVAGLSIPIPGDKDKKGALWPADLGSWNRQHKAVCHAGA